MKKKVAFLVYSLSHGGAERVVSTLANEFCEKYDVFVITLVECSSFYQLDEKITILNCGLLTKNRNLGINRIFQYLKTINNLKNIINNNHIEIVVSFMTVVNIFSIVSSKVTGVPCIISERNNPLINKPGIVWEKLRGYLYKFSDLLIVQTKANSQFYSKLMPLKKIRIIPNPLGSKLAKKRILPKKEDNQNIILSVGRLDKNKAQDLLIRAYANLPSNDWQIKIVGDGLEKSNYQDLAKTLRVEDKVDFVGIQNNIENFYNQAKIFVFTSKSEGFPNALIEAMYFGLACISTNCEHGPSELIVSGENGFLIDINDQKALEQKMLLLMNNEKKIKLFSTNAIEQSKAYEASVVKDLWDTQITSFLKS